MRFNIDSVFENDIKNYLSDYPILAFAPHDYWRFDARYFCILFWYLHGATCRTRL